jgi:hypothetical protein
MAVQNQIWPALRRPINSQTDALYDLFRFLVDCGLGVSISFLYLPHDPMHVSYIQNENNADTQCKRHQNAITNKDKHTMGMSTHKRLATSSCRPPSASGSCLDVFPDFCL